MAESPGRIHDRPRWPKGSVWLLLLSIALTAAAQPAAAQPAAAQELLPHFAVYELGLSKARRNDSVSAVSGRYRFEVKDVCDGWAMKHEAQLTVSYLSGKVSALGWRLGTWEAKDGQRYRFILHRLSGAEPVQEVRGTATLEAAGGHGKVTYPGDGGEPTPLPRGTVFPADQSIQLLNAARGGELPKWWSLFDGWDQTVVGLSAVLVARYDAGEPGPFRSPLLDRQASWRVQVGYYDLASASGEPEQEQEIRVYGNGIVDEFLFDYGDFSVDGTLISLEAPAPPEC